MPLYLLVTGSRDWDDALYIWSQLTRLHLIHGSIELHHGQCPEGGADKHADEWGKAFMASGVSVVPHPMDRVKYGRRAGPIRNSAMVKLFRVLLLQGKPVACHAFHRNNSRGTNDCAYKALVAGIPVVTHVWNGDNAIQTVTEEQPPLFPLLPEAA